MTRLSKKVFRVDVEFVTAAQEFQGLTNGYLDPSLLGADRWLALIGAWTLARSARCVVDAGTAVKVDSVDAQGQHLGGLIVDGDAASAVLPGVIPRATPKFVSDTRRARMLASETPSGFAVLESHAEVTYDDGSKKVLSHQIAYEPTPGYVRIEVFMAQHLAAYDTFLADLYAALTALNFQKSEALKP